MNSTESQIFFPHWKVRSIVGNFDFEESRRTPARRKRISWGRCVSLACRWFLTEIQQTELQEPADSPGWKYARIRVLTEIEKIACRNEGQWTDRATIECASLTTRVEQRETNHPFRIRAYLEVSRLQCLTRNLNANRPHSSDGWSSSFRKSYMSFRRGPTPERKFDSWSLCFNRLKRRIKGERIEWRTRITNVEIVRNHFSTEDEK